MRGEEKLVISLIPARATTTWRADAWNQRQHSSHQTKLKNIQSHGERVRDVATCNSMYFCQRGGVEDWHLCSCWFGPSQGCTSSHRCRIQQPSERPTIEQGRLAPRSMVQGSRDQGSRASALNKTGARTVSPRPLCLFGTNRLRFDKSCGKVKVKVPPGSGIRPVARYRSRARYALGIQRSSQVPQWTDFCPQNGDMWRPLLPAESQSGSSDGCSDENTKTGRETEGRRLLHCVVPARGTEEPGTQLNVGWALGSPESAFSQPPASH